MDLAAMEFTKLEKDTDNRSRLSVDATYHINNKGKGTLRFTKNGMDKLTKIIGTDYIKLFDLYINKETQSLAFQVSETGKFKLSGSTLIYENLSRAFRKEMKYIMVESPMYSFVLIPENIQPQQQSPVEAQTPVAETEKVEEPASSIESPSPTKKARGKKK